MSTSSRICLVLSLTLGCLLISPASGQQAGSLQPAGADSASTVFASNAILEAELADLRNRLHALDEAAAGKWEGEDVRDAVCPGWLVSVDYLNWNVRQRGTDDAIPTDDTAVVGQGAVQHLDLDRNSGVRTSLGYRTSSGWELMLGYTYFQTGGTASAAAPSVSRCSRSACSPTASSSSASSSASASSLPSPMCRSSPTSSRPARSRLSTGSSS